MGHEPSGDQKKNSRSVTYKPHYEYMYKVSKIFIVPLLSESDGFGKQLLFTYGQGLNVVK